MLKRALAFGAFAALLAGQDTTSTSGVSVPVTISGGAMYSKRAQSDEPDASPASGAFRAVLYPNVRLGPNWFGYAAVQVRSTPYFYYDAFDAEHEVYANVLQAFVGYSLRREKFAMVLKAGKLSSAFGAFPLRYDDAENPLLDQPLSYIADVPLHADQIPCGTGDLVHEDYGSASHYCGGTPRSEEGLVPVTLYGLPGVQAEISAGRVDARLQLTSRSLAIGQYLQWTAGGGYTIRQGFRVGVSGFSGPYLDREVASLLPTGTTVRNFPASGLGVDAQWARGRWSASGEYQRFRFDSPNFNVSPSLTSGYVEVKSVLTPRLYLAGRAGFWRTGRIVDNAGFAEDDFAPRLQSYEFAVGCWVTRNQLLKASYEWLRVEGQSGTRSNVLGLQYVMQFHSLAWAW